MSIFSNQIPRSNESVRFLPLFHTCEGYMARSHFASNSIITNEKCEVFNEKITYLFYGKPAYKYGVEDKIGRMLSIYPVCFIMDIELINNIQRVYPFDSGAMHHKLYSDFLDNRFKLIDFEIEPEPTRISDIILKFYGSNKNYISTSMNDSVVDPLEFESQAFREMASSKMPAIADERRVTIEVQAGPQVPFSGGTLKGVIAPLQYLDSPLFQAFRKKTNFSFSPYEIDCWNPKYAFSQVAARAKEYMRSEGHDV